MEVEVRPLLPVLASFLHSQVPRITTPLGPNTQGSLPRAGRAILIEEGTRKEISCNVKFLFRCFTLKCCRQEYMHVGHTLRPWCLRS